jgi:putative tricarboxylic transport membrane protein
MGWNLTSKNRRTFTAVGIALMAATCSITSASQAADYPAKDIHYIVAAGVGGGSDILARTLAKVLEQKKLLPVNVLVENRTGGSGAIGYTYINGQVDNPYILGGVGVSFFTTPLLGKMPINYTNFTPLAAIARSPYILAVRAESPIKSLDDLKTAKGLKIGTVGAVSDPALLASMTNEQLGADIKSIPYDGEGEVLAAVLGGHLDLMYGNPNEILEQIKAGTVRPLAVTSPERMSSLPDVLTFKELGYDITHTQLRGIIMPAGTPPDVVAYWEGVLKTVAESPEWKAEYIDRFNEVPLYMSSTEFGAQMVETSKRYEKMMRELKLIQ